MIRKKGESLIRKSTNRYLTTVELLSERETRRFDDLMAYWESTTNCSKVNY